MSWGLIPPGSHADGQAGGNLGKGASIVAAAAENEGPGYHGRLWAVGAKDPLISFIPLLADKTTHIPSQMEEKWFSKSSEMGPLPRSGQGTEEEK